MRRRVCVTGIGMVTPLGGNATQTWRRMVAGETAICLRPQADREDRPVAVAQVDSSFCGSDYVDDPRALRLLDRATVLGVSAAIMAARDAGLDFLAMRPGRLGAFVGAPGRDYEAEDFFSAVMLSTSDRGVDFRRFGAIGLDAIAPTWTLKGLGNNGLYFISVKYRAVGANANFVSGGDASLVAIGEAFRAIERDRLDTAFAGGYDSLLAPNRLAMYRSGGFLSGSLAASRAFDSFRDGFAVAEGAAFLVLEAEEQVARRGGHSYGRVTGYGTGSSAQTIEGLGAARRGFADCLTAAMRDAESRSLAGLFAHGLATRDSDREEAAGVATALAPLAARTAVAASKVFLGNTCAAAGAIDAAAACLALRDARLPPLQLASPDPDCPLTYADGAPLDGRSVLSVGINAANLAGAHASLIVARAR